LDDNTHLRITSGGPGLPHGSLAQRLTGCQGAWDAGGKILHQLVTMKVPGLVNIQKAIENGDL